MMHMEPRIAVVTGYAKNPEFIKTLLKSLEAQSWSRFDCFIYASPDCFYFLKDEFIRNLNFQCFHVILGKNKGFAGNNNEMLEMALRADKYTYVALINDDTIPDPLFLEQLVKTAISNPNVGAVAAKMVFYQPFITITGYTSVERKKDGRNLGVRFYLNSRFSDSYYTKRFYKKGFGRQEEDEIGAFRWTDEKFVVQIPVVAHAGESYRFMFFVAKNAALGEQWLMLKIGGFRTRFVLHPLKNFYEFNIPAQDIANHCYDIIQNAGTSLKGTGTIETGFGETDEGQYDKACNVDLFCGGACLLATQALEQCGLFLEGYFNYYEDSDLSIRIKQKGFHIVHSPRAVIRHYHAATTKEWSPFFTYYAFRNKIIFAKRGIGWSAFITAWNERLRETWLHFKRYIRAGSQDVHEWARLKLNMIILKDALMGIARFKVKFPGK